MGALVGDGARGLELLAGEDYGTVYTRGNLAAEVQGVQTEIAPILAFDHCVGATVTCHLTVQMTEFGRVPMEDELSALQSGLENESRQVIAEAISGLRLLDADAVGVMRQLGMDVPSQWANIQQMDFTELPIAVAVQVELRGR